MRRLRNKRHSSIPHQSSMYALRSVSFTLPTWSSCLKAKAPSTILTSSFHSKSNLKTGFSSLRVTNCLLFLILNICSTSHSGSPWRHEWTWWLWAKNLTVRPIFPTLASTWPAPCSTWFRTQKSLSQRSLVTACTKPWSQLITKDQKSYDSLECSIISV